MVVAYAIYCEFFAKKIITPYDWIFDGWASSVRMLTCICGITAMTQKKDHLDQVIYVPKKMCNNKSIK